MTGYGRGVISTPSYSITIDVKSINHRFVETYFKLPKIYLFLEDRLRREVNNRIARGKIEVTVTIEKLVTEENLVQVNQSLFASYMTAFDQLKQNFGLNGNVDIQTIINLPDVFRVTQSEIDQELLSGFAVQALNSGLDSLIISRQSEGDRLVKNLQEKLSILSSLRLQLIELAPLVVSAYQEKLTKRILELMNGIEIDPARIAMEVAIFADKSDINEELVRLESHLLQFTDSLRSPEPIGRRLDFLVQELNREINTVGSKANDLKIAQLVIDFKSELEKIREQIQNIE